MKYGKGIAVLLCAALLAGTLAGCGRKGSENGETGTGMEPVKGRYVETEEALPKQLEEWTVKQLFMEEGKPHLVAVRKEEGKLVFQEWAQTEEGFADVTADWMAGLALPVSGEWTEVRLLVPGEGKRCLYAGYAEEGEDDFKAHLWTEENGEAKEITPEKWKTLDEELGVYEMLTGIVALENGTLAAISFTSAYILDGQDGTVLESGEITAQYDNVLSDGENVWLYATYSAGAGLTFERWREGRTDDAVSVTFSEGDGQMRFCPMKDGTLFLAGEEGIFRGTGSAESGDGISWQKLLAGVETDFSLSDRWCTEIAAGEDGTIYALFQKSGGGSLLKKYEYDPEAVIEVTEELKLYTVYESNLLNQAAAMYHREHPEVMITIEYEYPRYYYDETDYSAVYQKLNTMLMGEEAPDILVMDHLDMDSYAEKGLLEDINDVVGPMEENGELLSNITSAYLQEDGRRYVVPLEFAFNMAVGRDITAADMASVEALAAFLSGQNVSYMGAHRQKASALRNPVQRIYQFTHGYLVQKFGAVHFSPVSHENALHHQNIFQVWTDGSPCLLHVPFHHGKGQRLSLHPPALRVVDKPQQQLFPVFPKKFHDLPDMKQRLPGKGLCPEISDVDQRQGKPLRPAAFVQPCLFFHRPPVRSRLCPESIDMIPAAAGIGQFFTAFPEFRTLKLREYREPVLLLCFSSSAFLPCGILPAGSLFKSYQHSLSPPPHPSSGISPGI